MLGPRNLRLSGDVMGEASRRLEQALGVPALFVNGAVGDVSPGAPRRARDERPRRRAGAAGAGGLGTGRRRSGGPRWRSAELSATLPAPRLSARNCLRRLGAARDHAAARRGVFPRETTLTAVAVGDVGWVTIPGELQTALGRGIKQRGRRAAAAHARGRRSRTTTSATSSPPPTTTRPGLRHAARASTGRDAGTCLAEAAAGLLSARSARGEPSGPARARWRCDRMSAALASGRRSDGGRARTSCGRRCCGG